MVSTLADSAALMALYCHQANELRQVLFRYFSGAFLDALSVAADATAQLSSYPNCSEPP